MDIPNEPIMTCPGGKRIFSCGDSILVATDNVIHRYIGGKMSEIPIGGTSYVVTTNNYIFILGHCTLRLSDILYKFDADFKLIDSLIFDATGGRLFTDENVLYYVSRNENYKIYVYDEQLKLIDSIKLSYIHDILCQLNCVWVAAGKNLLQLYNGRVVHSRPLMDGYQRLEYTCFLIPADTGFWRFGPDDQMTKHGSVTGHVLREVYDNPLFGGKKYAMYDGRDSIILVKLDTIKILDAEYGTENQELYIPRLTDATIHGDFLLTLNDGGVYMRRY